MKKFFLLFALLSCVSFNDAFASLPPPVTGDECSVTEGYNGALIVCDACAMYFAELRHYRIDIGCAGDGSCDGNYGFPDIVENVREALVWDSHIYSCLQPVVNAFDDMVQAILYTDYLPIDWCAEQNFCGCAVDWYADIYINDYNYGDQVLMCTECPNGGEGAGWTYPITSCYLPAGYSETDSTGRWEFTQACNYK